MPALIILGVCILLGIGLSLFSAFLTNIILVDSIALGLISFLYTYNLPIHLAFKILIAIVIAAIIYGLQRTSVGFWIVGLLMSLGWAALFTQLVAEATENDLVWMVVTGVVSFLIMVGLHLAARNRLRLESANEAMPPMSDPYSQPSNYIPSPPTLSEVQELRDLAKYVDMLSGWVAMLKDPDDNIHEAVAQEHLDRSLNMPGFNALAFKADYIRQIERLERERSVLENPAEQPH